MKRPAPMSRHVFVDVRGYKRFKDERCLYLHGGYAQCFRTTLAIGCPFTSLPKENSVYLEIWRWSRHVPSKFLYKLVSRHYMTSQKTTVRNCSSVFCCCPSPTKTFVGQYENIDRPCGLVVRVLGYRSGGPGSIPGTTNKKSSGSGTGSTQPREYNWGATW
jgi:hypothetical protein